MSESQLSGNKTFTVTDIARLSGASLGPALRLLLRPDTLRQWPRLLHEGTDPIVHFLIQAGNTAVINRWLEKGTSVFFLSSFPRSGNTWMRYLLSDILLQMQEVETTTQLPVHPNDLISYLNGHLIARRCPHWAAEPRAAFVKTHASFAQLEQILSGHGRQNGNCRAVYLYRSPEDTLVSLYHLPGRDAYSRSRALHDIDAFCRREVSGWMENISSYMRAADSGFPVFFISYELMLEKPEIVLSDLLRWLGLKHDGDMAQRAVANMQFDKLQAMEIQQNKTRNLANEQKLFFRRGCTGSGRAELQESTLREIQQQTASLMSEANHHRMKQPSEHPVPVMAATDPAPLRNGEAREPKTTPCLQQV